MMIFIKTIFGVFWLVATLFLGYLMHIVFATESDLQIIWSWAVLCVFTFMAASFIACLVLFSPGRKREND